MYGNKVAATPNMDSLAANGVTFDTHYCNSPLCAPSHLSITAGKYVSRIDMWDNTCEPPNADMPSLPRVLNAAGYQSFLCGRQHYDYTRRYGFTEIGGNFNNNYKTGRCQRRKPDQTQAPRMGGRFRQFHPGPHNEVLEHDRAVTAGTLDFLSKRDASDKPFFLYTGYLAPHFPLIVPEDIYLKYKGRIEMPDIPPGFFDTLPLNYRLLRAGFQEINVPPNVTLTGRELYHGMVDWIDREIGKILAALRARPELAVNTLIIYASDHGENMGEHGMWWKNCMYEQASRVPLIFHFPQRWPGGQRRAGASSHVDLVKTVIDLGGGTAPGDWSGDSLLPWLDDPAHVWKDCAVSEYYGRNIGSGYMMSRSGDWKCTYHSQIDDEHPPQRQLFNLATDPNEFNNVADTPENARRVAEMHRRMLVEIGTTSFEAIEQRARRQMAEGYHRAAPQARAEGNVGGLNRRRGLFVELDLDGNIKAWSMALSPFCGTIALMNSQVQATSCPEMGAAEIAETEIQSHTLPRQGDMANDWLCAWCLNRVASEKDRLCHEGRSEFLFSNPEGIRFHIFTFSRTIGCRRAGESTLEHTWFPGHAWCFCVCDRCRTHLGWHFAGPSDFVGLIRDRIVRASVAFN